VLIEQGHGFLGWAGRIIITVGQQMAAARLIRTYGKVVNTRFPSFTD
jgi:hypothetical protein